MKMQHPDSSNRPIDVPADRVELMKSNGWVEHESKPADDKK